MSSVTFGSVGDIITVCLLAKSIVEALDDSRGSSAEYQGLINELRSLEASLLEAELFTRSWTDASTAVSLQHECSKLVNECRKTLQAFQTQLEKYDSSLSKDSRVGIMKRARIKIKWQLLAKDTVSRFRNELAGHSNALNMMMITASVMISLGDRDTQKATAFSIERSLAAQDAKLDNLRSEIQSNSELASSMTSIVRTMSHQLRWFSKLLVSVKSMLSRGFRLNLATHQAVLSIQESLSQSMDRTLIQDPFVLEDPLGRVAPVHLQFITSWKAFYAVLATRFEGLPGRDKIERREFVLQERATSREISGEDPWEIAFRPGSSVCMSLLFQRDVKTAESKSHCPYCGSISEKATADDVHWRVALLLETDLSHLLMPFSEKCSMVYRRIIEVTEIDQPTIPDLPKHWSQQPAFGRTGFNVQPPTLGPFLKRKRSMESWEELSLSEEVRNFKRVRILSNIKKTRRAAFSSWEDKMSWTMPESKQFNAVGRNDSLEASTTSTSGIDPALKNLPTEGTILSGASFYPEGKEEELRERVPAHAMNTEKDDSDTEDDKDSDAQQQRTSSAKHAHASRTDFHDYAPFDPAQWGGSNEIWIVTGNFIPNNSLATRLNAKRAKILLQTPASGGILSPGWTPVRRVLDIGPSNARAFIAVHHMTESQIQNIQTWDHLTSKDLVCQIGTYEDAKYDLIHMQDLQGDGLSKELFRILRPGGRIEIKTLELRIQRNSGAPLHIFPWGIHEGFSSIDITSFSHLEEIRKSFAATEFINMEAHLEKFPITDLSGLSDGEVPGSYFKELLCQVSKMIEEDLEAFSLEIPLYSSRSLFSMIQEVRAALSFEGDNRTDFVGLVRITAEKPI